MIRRRPLLLAALAGIVARGARADAPAPSRSHAVSLLSKPALPPDFPYFPYLNPEAPKGGEVALSAVGSFDSFHPFIVRGTPASDIIRVYDPLLAASADEASTAYGHLAKTVEIAPDGMWVAFELRPEAHFHDGKPVTAEDVAWTFDQLRKEGRPFYRQYYADVADAVAESPTRAVFHLKTNRNRELPLILGEMLVLPKHWWEGRDFSRPLTDPPLGSGAYSVDHVDFGRTIAYRRVNDWWAANLPTGRGRFNFDIMRTEYFRDPTVALEAFKAGQIDFRQENVAKQWATAYDFPAVGRGLVKKEQIRHHLPTGMQGFVMNSRREQFKDRRVRQALAWVFDFEWANKNLFYGTYTRTKSYYSNSDFESSGLPSTEELALLEPFRDKLPPELFKQEYTLRVTDGSGNNREQIRQAYAMLKDTGWKMQDMKLVDGAGKQMTFEILLDEPAFERVALPYVQTLAKLGIDAHVRTVDPAQYQRLLDTYDFDMTVAVFAESDNPGNEQVGYWSTASGKQEGGDNLAGVADPVVDALVDRVINAGDRQQLITITRALDRALLWGWYVVPHWHMQSYRVAYWDRFARPEKPIRAGLAFDTWWLDQARAAATDAARRA